MLYVLSTCITHRPTAGRPPAGPRPRPDGPVTAALSRRAVDLRRAVTGAGCRPTARGPGLTRQSMAGWRLSEGAVCACVVCPPHPRARARSRHGPRGSPVRPRPLPRGLPAVARGAAPPRSSPPRRRRRCGSRSRPRSRARARRRARPTTAHRRAARFSSVPKSANPRHRAAIGSRGTGPRTRAPAEIRAGRPPAPRAR